MIKKNITNSSMNINIVQMKNLKSEKIVQMNIKQFNLTKKSLNEHKKF